MCAQTTSPSNTIQACAAAPRNTYVDQILDVMRRAFHALRSGPGGPMVELTSDAARTRASSCPLGALLRCARHRREPTSKTLRALVKPGDRAVGRRRCVPGYRAAARAGRTAGAPLLHHAGQVVLRRTPSAALGAGARHDFGSPPLACTTDLVVALGSSLTVHHTARRYPRTRRSFTTPIILRKSTRTSTSTSAYVATPR